MNCIADNGACTSYACLVATDPQTGECPAGQMSNVCSCQTKYCDGSSDDGKEACCGDGCPRHRNLAVKKTGGEQPQPQFPAAYTCESIYTQQGAQYKHTNYVKTGIASAVVGLNSRVLSFNADKTNYQISPTWCTPSVLYAPVTSIPKLAPAYHFMGQETIAGVLTDRFGEDDQWANHSVYFKQKSWEVVQVVDADQQKAGMAEGTIYFSNCKEGVDESMFEVPASCKHA